MSSVLVLILFFCTLHLASSAHRSHHNRRFLHQPLFPSSLMPPSPSPTSLPAQKQQPKLPASDSPDTPGKSPFFPSYASPSTPPPPQPPPPSSDVPTTFPANISSLVLPQSPSPRKSISTKLLAVTTVALSTTLASVIILILYYRRRSYRFSLAKASRSDSLRLYPANSAPSDGGSICLKPPRGGASGPSSEFIYLGTLVSPRGGADECDVTTDSGTVIPSVTAYHKLGSPELLPLPPLPRKKAHRNVSSADAGSSMSDDEDDENEEEVFYSPRGSSSSCGKETAFQAVEVENLGRRSFNSPARSYPSSNTASPTSQSTLNHTPSPPPLRPPPPAPSRRRATVLTPSPERELPARVYDFSQPSAGQSPERVGGVGVFSGQEHPPKVPPAPPPPPLGYGETLNAPNVSREPYSGPPILIRPSRHVVSQNGAPLVSQGGQFRNGDDLVAGEDSSKPKLKPLHWDKVRASSDRAMVWDLLKSNSFKLDEETIETLFTVHGSNSLPKENPRRAVPMIPSQENQMLDPKKSQNIAILLKALNVTVDEVCETILEGNADTLGTEFLESMLKMAPTEEEERKLKDFKDEFPVKLGPAERFLRAVIDIPFAFRRVEAMLYIANFDSEVDYLKRAFETLLVACEELRNSKMFQKLLEAVLKTGNRMNVGTSRGDAHAFKLDTLLKLVDVKGADGKTTLLHFVVQEIIRAEGAPPSNSDNHSKAAPSDLRDDLEFRKRGLQVVSHLSSELMNVKKAATMDSEALSNDAGKLAGGVAKVKEVVKLMGQLAALEESDLKFCESMHAFLDRAGVEIAGIHTHQKAAFSSVRDLTVYFHGNSAREEARPLRIFMVVRDFLSTLNKVCKEVGKINERTVFSSAIFSSGRVLAQHSNPPMPPFVECNRNHQGNSSAEESSSSSSTAS